MYLLPGNVAQCSGGAEQMLEIQHPSEKLILPYYSSLGMVAILVCESWLVFSASTALLVSSLGVDKSTLRGCVAAARGELEGRSWVPSSRPQA